MAAYAHVRYKFGQKQPQKRLVRSCNASKAAIFELPL